MAIIPKILKAGKRGFYHVARIRYRGKTGLAFCFVRRFEQKQLWGRYAVTGSGCLGTCGNGPTVQVYPEGVMYGGVNKDDLSAIIEEHLLGGKLVERLEVPEVIWG